MMKRQVQISSPQVLIGLLILLIAAGFATAATINVPADYNTIQAAIDAAVDGDEVVVADGVYTGAGNYNLDFSNGLPIGQTRAITVRSANGPENCIIDCNGLGRGFYFHSGEDPNSKIEGFTITNGNANYGGAIECEQASPTISNCIITGNSAYDGGGIDCYDASPIIIDCVITGNTAENDGGGIESYEATPTIINSLIQGNSAGRYGGAIDCYNSSPTITNCTIIGNSGVSNYGGVFADYTLSSPTITNSILWGNGDDLVGCTATYSCIEDGGPGTGNISGDPLFRKGPLGDYYLSQVAAGQLADSNCVDAGSTDANDPGIGLDTYTTRTDSVFDVNTVDMGYHYPDSGLVVQYQLTTSVVNDPNGNGSIDPNSGLYNQFSEVALTAAPDAAFKVKAWTGTDDDSSIGLNNIVTITAAKTVTIEFEPRIVYQLTTLVVNGIGGSIDPNSGPQYEGDVVPLTATPDIGYQVKAWTGTDDNNSVDPNNYVTMDSDKTVTVEFVTSSVSLDVRVIDGNGAVSPKRGNYAVGTVVSLTATPDPFYRVKQWTGTDDDSSTDPNNTVTMTEDKSVTVKFEPIPLYQLTTSVVNKGYGLNGTIQPSSGLFYDGTVVALTATPDLNYEVAAWTGTDDDLSTELNNTVTINGSDVNVTVAFEPSRPVGILPANSNAITFYNDDPNVMQNPDNWYPTIQDAIDAAEANDVIVVGDGTYAGEGNRDLHFNAVPITVRSELGPKYCIIDAEGSGRGFIFKASDANDPNTILDPNYIVRGFTIKNGFADLGGGLYYEGISAPLVDDCIIIDNTATIGGGGVYFNVVDANGVLISDVTSQPIITNSKIIRNTSGGNGGGIFCKNASSIITNTEISYNKSGFQGGGIYCEAGSAPEIINCLITYNESDDIGGSIYLFESDAIINLSTIAYNTGRDYGDSAGDRPYGPKGGICARDSTPEITNCIIWGNGDDLYGGADATYSDIEDLIDSTEDEGEGNIAENPLFITGGLGDFYLSQLPGGSPESPCLNAAQQYILGDLQNEYDLGFLTTSILNQIDYTPSDMGFHYPFYTGPPILYKLEISVTDNGYITPAPGVYYYTPGTGIGLEAYADDGYRGYWSGTDDDTSFNTWNTVTMYSDRAVIVSFEFIQRRNLYVPDEYPVIQDAIDAAKYGDTIILSTEGSPYRTSMGFLVQNSRAITITSTDPNNPDVVAATVIEMERPIGTGWVGRAFTFANVGPNTVLDGLTIRGFRLDVTDGLDGEGTGAPGENGGNWFGGAILCWGASPTIKNCVIRDNWVRGGDGGNGVAGGGSIPNGGDGGWPGKAYGGGMAIMYGSDPNVINCTFENNAIFGGNGGNGGNGRALSAGGGFGGRGGGWFYGQNSVWYGTPWPYAYRGYYDYGISSDGFYDFYTEHSGRGGAVFVGEDCSPTFTDCTFTNNRSEGGTTGICGQDNGNQGRQEPGLHWKIDNFGGAVFSDSNSSPTFINCTFNDNLADPNRPIRDYNEPEGPGNYDNDDSVVGFGGAVAFKYNANVTFDNCTFNGNSADEGGAMYWAQSDPLISNSSFVDNSAASGGAILFVGGSGKIASSTFSGNDANGAFARGGAICSLGANAVIADCNISNNDANGSGGGIYISGKDFDGNDIVLDGENIFSWNNATVINCLITGNSANGYGGGISANWGSEPNIINCTIADNTVTGTGFDTGYGGGLYSSYGSYTTIINSIIWGNSADNGYQIAIGNSYGPATVNITYSNIQGGGAVTQAPATGGDTWIDENCTLEWDVDTGEPAYPTNLTGTSLSDPLFVTGPLGHYYLSQIDANDANYPNQNNNSPCVDKGIGEADSLPFGPYRYTTRTDNVKDVNNIDMGYHYPKSGAFADGDLNYDGVVNFDDYYLFTERWLYKQCSFPGWCEGSDLDQDGTVDFSDMSILNSFYGDGDTEKPTPDPMTWAVAPVSAGQTSITMTATKAFDNSGLEVYYYFQRVDANGNPDGGFRGWDPNRTHTDTGLDPNTEYGYRVRATDRSGKDYNESYDPNDPDAPNAGNKTEWSFIGYAITGEGGAEIGAAEPPTWISEPSATSPNSISMEAATSDSGGIGYTKYYFEETSGNPGGSDSGWLTSPTYENTGLDPNTAYTYRVKAIDENDKTTDWSTSLSATTLIEGAVEDTTPPVTDAGAEDPYKSTFDVTPYEYVGTDGKYYHTMTATTATDDTGPVEYYFYCSSYDTASSGWQESPTYDVLVGSFSHDWWWQVKTRDKVQPIPNEGNFSDYYNTNGSITPYP